MKRSLPSFVCRQPGWAQMSTALLSGTLAAWPAKAGDPAPAAEAKPEPAKESSETSADDKEAASTDLRNWFSVSVGGVLTSGDQAAFQRRYQTSTDLFGGVEAFHYEQSVGKNGQFKADGRGLFDNHDYRLRLELSNPEVGYVRAGYHEARTWYDGSGGYLPLTGAWYSLYDEDLTTDRGEVYLEGGLTLPKVPRISFGYRHTFRDGLEDSTSWGQSTQAGSARGIVPSFYELDEQTDRFSLDVKHHVGKTGFELGVSYELGNLENSRHLRQNPGEPADAHVTQKDGTDYSLFNLHAHSETRLSAKAMVTLGYAFTDMDNDFTGYRIYGTGYDPDLAQRLPNANTFENLMGGSQMSQHLVNLNLMFRLSDALILVPSVRVEKQDAEGLTQYSLPATPLSPNLYDASSERGLLDVSEALDLRYTGITNVVLYAKGTWLQGSGDLEETWDNLANQANVLARATDDDRTSQKYSVGANYYPLRRLNFGAEYYHKIRENDYEHGLDTTPNTPTSLSRYPAFLTAQDFTTDDVNFRVTWRPRGNLSFVARYDYQQTQIDSAADNLSTVESGDMTSHILSGSASWAPFARLYLQGSISYVDDLTDTPADDLTQAVQRGENRYWTGNLGGGYALDNKTDLELQYLYYRADNYADNSTYGVPYGAGLEEHGITAGLVRRVSPRVRVSLKYGFFTSTDETSGNHNDYDAHLIYSSLTYRF